MTPEVGVLDTSVSLPSEIALQVIEGVKMDGSINTPEPVLLEQIRHSIRLGHPQIRPQGVQKDRVLLVGGGPSLAETFNELRDLHFEGAKIVTVNGAYAWCLERNLRPSMQIVLDARPGNARFVDPDVPQCAYALASQCHPETWAKVQGRSSVWIWHAMGPENGFGPEMDAYYGTRWHGIAGGTTVAMRAVSLLRTLGYLRIDLFGIDSCVFDKAQHHAYAQPENDKDQIIPVTAHPTGHPELARRFWCAPWHIKQVEDALQMIRLNGQHFVLNVHGDGLLAFVLRASGADVELRQDAAEEK